ncbi:MAG: hypothetical protein IT380_04440 [Myxococcales bacterium]|nr:hypothetical protein [Myxococcales bacterium]
MTPLDAVLLAALGHVVDAPDVEAGFERVKELTGADFDFASFRFALAAAIREGLLLEPIRLPPGALHCHWRLELTPKGLAAARAAAR